MAFFSDGGGAGTAQDTAQAYQSSLVNLANRAFLAGLPAAARPRSTLETHPQFFTQPSGPWGWLFGQGGGPGGESRFESFTNALLPGAGGGMSMLDDIIGAGARGVGAAGRGVGALLGSLGRPAMSAAELGARIAPYGERLGPGVRGLGLAERLGAQASPLSALRAEPSSEVVGGLQRSLSRLAGMTPEAAESAARYLGGESGATNLFTRLGGRGGAQLVEQMRPFIQAADVADPRAVANLEALAARGGQVGAPAAARIGGRAAAPNLVEPLAGRYLEALRGLPGATQTAATGAETAPGGRGVGEMVRSLAGRLGGEAGAVGATEAPAAVAEAAKLGLGKRALGVKAGVSAGRNVWNVAKRLGTAGLGATAVMGFLGAGEKLGSGTEADIAAATGMGEDEVKRGISVYNGWVALGRDPQEAAELAFPAIAQQAAREEAQLQLEQQRRMEQAQMLLNPYVQMVRDAAAQQAEILRGLLPGVERRYRPVLNAFIGSQQASADQATAAQALSALSGGVGVPMPTQPQAGGTNDLVAQLMAGLPGMGAGAPAFAG